MRRHNLRTRNRGLNQRHTQFSLREGSETQSAVKSRYVADTEPWQEEGFEVFPSGIDWTGLEYFYRRR